MANKVIAIVGLSGTGKSVATEYLKNTYQLTSIYFGGYVLEEVRKRGLEVNSNNERMIREDLRAINGMDAIAKLAIDKINILLQEDKHIIIDGLYSFTEYTFLKNILHDQLILIATHSEKAIRYERLAQRPVRPLTKEEVEKRDFLEIAMIEKGGPIAIADYHIINNKDEAYLYSELNGIVQRIGL
jgi:dephospho-CoA kinase